MLLAARAKAQARRAAQRGPLQGALAAAHGSAHAGAGHGSAALCSLAPRALRRLAAVLRRTPSPLSYSQRRRRHELSGGRRARGARLSSRLTHPQLYKLAAAENSAGVAAAAAAAANGHAAKNSVPRPQSGQAGVALKLSEGHVRPQSKSF